MNNLNKNKDYDDNYMTIENKEIEKIRKIYKIIDVDWLSPIIVSTAMFTDDYFEKFPQKKVIINSMMSYYLNHKYNVIYHKTDYICNEKEKICICNTHAEDLRKLFGKDKYKPNNKYISWFIEKK